MWWVLLISCLASLPTSSSPLSPEDDVPSDTGSTPVDPPDGLVQVAYRVHETLPTLVYATWDQLGTHSVHVEYSFDDGVWLASPTRTLDTGPHEEILLGIPYGATVTFRVVLDGGAPSKPLAVTTESLPVAFPEVQLLAYDTTQADLVNAPYLWTAIGTDSGITYACMLDRQGRVVWASRLPNNRTSLHPRVAKDGRSLYRDYNSYWQIFDEGAGSTVDQILIDGTILHTFETPGLHHPFTDLPDGSLAYGESIGMYGNEYLTRVQLDGSRDRLWSCEGWLSDIGENGYCSSNTLNYDVATNKYLFSFWSLETIVEIDGTSAEVARWFGHVAGAYAFDPIESTFWWQHGGYLTDAGTLLTSSDRASNGVETVVREYAIDDATQTLHEIWNFGLDEGVYGYQMGEAIRLPSGNTLHNYGEMARVREATAEGEVVWDVLFPDSFIGRSMPVVDLYALAPDRL